MFSLTILLQMSVNSLTTSLINNTFAYEFLFLERINSSQVFLQNWDIFPQYSTTPRKCPLPICLTFDCERCKSSLRHEQNKTQNLFKKLQFQALSSK